MKPIDVSNERVTSYLILRLEEGLLFKSPIHSIRINGITFQKIVFFRVTVCETQISYMYYIHSAIMNDRPYIWTGINRGMGIGTDYRMRNANILVWRLEFT